jgi:hypothetical protein
MNPSNTKHDSRDVPQLFSALSLREKEKALAGAQTWYQQVMDRYPEWRRAVRLRRFRVPLHEFSQILVDYRKEQQLLEALLAIGQLLGLRRIRYYHYDQRNECLISVDCAGHTPDETLRLRLGNIVKPRLACPSDTSDSYTCIERRAPVFFEINRTQTAPMAERSPLGRLAVMTLSHGQCDDFLRDSPYHCRVDYPLMHAGEAVGKLSCDLEAARLTPRTAKWLLWFWKFVLRVAAPIERLRSSRIEIITPVAEEVRDEILRATSLRKLFDYCVDTLPKRFDILYASLFTVSTDATGSTRLILRRTSYPGSRHLEDGTRGQGNQVGYYQLAPDPDNSITAWVATSRHPVRIQRLGDAGLLRPQLAVLNSGLRWMNKIQDSNTHTSFLAVPILAAGRLLGVLRFTEKASGDARAYFTDIDEKCLYRIASDYVGPKLAELQIREAQGLFCDETWQQPVVKALTETFEPAANSDTTRRRHVNFQKAMRQLVQTTGQPRHLYLVNHMPLHGERFRHLAAAGALADRIKDRMDCSYDLEGTLTGRAIHVGTWVYLHDIPRAIERRYILPLLPEETMSALACPVFLGAKGQGAIVLHSDRHDIVPEVHGPLLHYLTSLTTGILTCRYKSYGEGI